MSGRTMYLTILAMVAIAGGYLLFIMMETAPRPVTPDDPQEVALGEGIYGQYCASCHGADLKGEPNWKERKADGTLPAPPHDETGHTWHHDDQLLLAYIRLGGAALFKDQKVKSAMPGFADTLSEAEIRAVLAFIKSRWPADIQKRQASLMDR